MTFRLVLGVALALAAVIVPSTASAQYFGRNKVQYEDFHFSVLQTAHFDIYYYDRESEAVQQAARLAERWYTRLSALLKHDLRGRQPLILYANHPDFSQTTALQGFIGEGTGGVTEALQRRMVLPFTASLAETSHVLGHELVHAFQFDMGERRTLTLPLWFVEGMAEYLSLGPIDAPTATWLRDAAIHDDLPDFDELTDPRYFPYRFGHAAWAYIAGRWGDAIVGDIFYEASRTGDPLGAIEALTRVPPEELSAGWHDAVVRAYASVGLSEVGVNGRPTITEEGSGGSVNVGPALSPDGSKLVFLSERNVLSIDAFLADARTGEVIRKLTSTATNPHLDSIQFLHSAGAWSPDSVRFAIPTVNQGTPTLRIIDVTRGDTVRDIEFDSLGEIVGPTWSPDGRRIAFSATRGGVSDLYVYDIDAASLDRLTDDLYADLQPAWSPDGATIAFVTDRFTTDLDALDFGSYQLARYDVSSRRVSPLRAFDSAKHINPQWAPDGRTIYFISDPNGISNVYRVDAGGGQPEALTSVATGVTGITATSPALSVAAREGTLAYTVYTDGRYEIVELGPDAGQTRITRTEAAILPPPDRGPSAVAQALASSVEGLPPPSVTFPSKPYDPDLSLVYAGAAVGAAAGVDEFGSFGAAGGLSLVFADILRQHQVSVTADVNGQVQDIGAQAAYLNQTSRWYWGVVGQRVPFRSGFISQGIGEVDGEPALIERLETFHQTDYRTELLTQYPFDRSTRLELSGGGRQITFNRDVDLRGISLITGELILDESRDLPASDSLTLGQASAALVYDTSLFGPTSPIVGTRARAEVTPVFGSLTFSEVLADYRRYFMPVRPFTLAARVMHFGRYGADSESTRLNPLFIGYPSLVRGYDVGSFEPAECLADASSGCPAFDRLLGTRMLVGGLELRFPLKGVFTGELDYGPLPVEGLVFADTGVAWTADDKASFLGGDRDFVSSVGAGVRVNVFGYLIAELDAVHALDRPRKNWQFVFSLRPGF